MLSTQPDMDVVAQAANGAEAIESHMSHLPDVTVIDLHLPDIHGDEVIRRIRKDVPDARFLVLTAFDTDELILRAMRAGAQGYLVKGTPKERLFEAVRTVHGGGTLLGPGLAPKLLGQVDAMGSAHAYNLSERELEVLKLVADGLRNKEIASILSLAERTVKLHLTRVYGKLDVTNRTEAMREAARRGIISL